MCDLKITIKGSILMETIKDEIISVINRMDDSVDIDEIMYHLYVIDKVKKGKEAAKDGRTTSIDQLKEEMKSW